jgi:hypothetical protein
MESDELTYTQNSGPLDVRWSMDSIIVDGITSVRPVQQSYASNTIFTLKSELNEFDEPNDTGFPFTWSSKYEVSEKHWLKCGVVIPKHSWCLVCGEREMQE